MSDFGFTAKSDDALYYRGEFEVATPGWKTVVITASENKPTKDALKLAQEQGRPPRQVDGEYLELTMEIVKSPIPSEIGIKIVDRLNIHHPNEKAQQISRAVLGKYLEVCSIPQATTARQLHGIIFDVKLKIDEFESNMEQGKMFKGNQITDRRKTRGRPRTAGENDKSLFKEDDEGWLA